MAVFLDAFHDFASTNVGSTSNFQRVRVRKSKKLLAARNSVICHANSSINCGRLHLRNVSCGVICAYCKPFAVPCGRKIPDAAGTEQ